MLLSKVFCCCIGVDKAGRVQSVDNVNRISTREGSSKKHRCFKGVYPCEYDTGRYPKWIPACKV